MRGVFAAVVGAVAAVLSCGPPAAFVCKADSECTLPGKKGRCEADTHLCSFPDDACVSGFRYPADAGGGVSGQCTTPGAASGTDAGSADGGTGGAATNTSTSGSASASASVSASASADASASASASADGTTGEPPPIPICGNGMIEPPEACDGNMIPFSCTDLGWYAGEIGCNPDCQALDQSGCTNCGNTILDDTEACDDTDLGGLGCADLGYQDGNLACYADCLALDASGCTGIACATDPSIPTSACPSECTECNDTQGCLIDCTGGGACIGADLTCPEGWPCTVVCSGGSACADATITCSSYAPCTVSCDGGGACGPVQVDCGDVGACELDCLNSTACLGAAITCGQDACTVSCPAANTVNFDCPSSTCACINEGCNLPPGS